MALASGTKLKCGDKTRAAIEQALRNAGAAGMPIGDLATVTGLAPNGVRWQLARMPCVVKASPTQTQFARLFHADFSAAAEAYLVEVAGRERRLNGPSEATHFRVLGIIQSAKVAGIGIKELMAVAKLQRSTVNAITPVLVRDHGVVMERMSGQGKGRPAHFWPSQECRQAWSSRVQRGPAKAAKPIMVSLGPSLAKAKMLGEAIIPAGLKVQVIPHNEDTRYTPTNVRPFFGQPGFRPDYLSTDTWGARAYGGRP